MLKRLFKGLKNSSRDKSLLTIKRVEKTLKSTQDVSLTKRTTEEYFLEREKALKVILSSYSLL